MKPSCDQCGTDMNFVVDADIEEAYFICPDCRWVLYDFDPATVTVEDLL